MRTPTVCKEYLENLVAYLNARGVSTRQLQAVMQLNPLAHISEHGRVPLRLFEMTLETGARLLDAPCLGAEAGTECSSKPWGMVNYLGMSAANTREALGVMPRFSRLLIDHGDVLFNDNYDNAVCMSWQPPPRQALSHHVVEFFFANWYRATKAMLVRGKTHREVYFCHKADGRDAQLTALYEAPVRFEQDFNGVCFDRALLDQPTRHPHPEIHKSLEQAALIELSNLQFEDRLIKEVRDCIVKRLAEGVPKLEVISEQLGIAPRTLQRRLNNIDSSYKSLVDEARKERSLGLISQEDLGLLDIAAELGFSDQSAFQKAFKRWYGQAPGRYRMMCRHVG